jgi:hypothetical protein
MARNVSVPRAPCLQMELEKDRCIRDLSQFGIYVVHFNIYVYK